MKKHKQHTAGSRKARGHAGTSQPTAERFVTTEAGRTGVPLRTIGEVADDLGAPQHRTR